jgi:ABC-type spermidine/putrescine transport system permease subunit I
MFGKFVMKALVLYVAFVLIGGLIATAVGYYVEIEFSSAASLVVFLTLFFANFVTSWIAVILVMDGTLADAQGRQAQLEIERFGSRGTDGRARSAG